MLVLAGLALAGFGGAGLAARGGSADVGTTATTSTQRATSTEAACTRAHPCANPGCTEAGHGPLDCFDVSTPTTTTAPPTTTAVPPPSTTETRPTTTGATTTTTPAVVPPPTTTTTAATSTESNGTPPPPPTTAATTTAAKPSGSPGAPFLPPPLRTRHRPAAPAKGSPVRTLPFTGANLTLVIELAAGLLGAGLVLVAAGRRPARLSAAGALMPAPSPLAPAISPRSRTSLGYRVIVPGVGVFATAAEAYSVLDELARRSYRDMGARGEADGE